MDKKEYKKYCKELKLLMFEFMKNGHSAHIGGSLSCIEALAVVYNEFIKNTNNKIIFSKGHCEVALYSLLIKENLIDSNLLTRLKCFGSKLQGHPSADRIPDIIYSSGSLGQGLSFSLGLALASVNESIYVFLGDGELQEGQIWEAVLSAPRLSAGNLNVIVDCNHLQLEGETLFTGCPETMSEIWKLFNWKTYIVDDGNDISQLKESFYSSCNDTGPKAYFINTKKGNGVSFMENNSNYHGLNLDPTIIEMAISEILESEK